MQVQAPFCEFGRVHEFVFPRHQGDNTQQASHEQTAASAYAQELQQLQNTVVRMANEQRVMTQQLDEERAKHAQAIVRTF